MAAVKHLADEERRRNKVALAERLLAHKQQTKREMRQEYKTDPHIQQLIANLKANNAPNESPA